MKEILKDFWFGFVQPSVLGIVLAVVLIHFYPAGVIS